VEINNDAADAIKVVAGLIGTTPDPWPTTEEGQYDWFAPAICAAKGHNDPAGYYEAVMNRGPDGRNRLFGWRYLGFASFAPCRSRASQVANRLVISPTCTA